MSQDAYVYAIVVDGVVRYIGKGSGIRMKRATEHFRTARRTIRKRAEGDTVDVELYLHHMLIRSLKSGSHVEAICLRDGLAHDEAFALEAKEIACATAGQLWNVSAGGRGGGEVCAETRAKQSASMRARLSTPEARALMAKRLNSIAPEDRAEAHRKSTIAKQDPAFKANMAAKCAARWQDERKAEGMRLGLEHGRRPESYTPARAAKRWADPSAREKHAEAMRKAWARKRAS